MIKCKDGMCEKYGDRCCCECNERQDCENNCNYDYESCDCSEVITTDIAVFQTKALATMQKIAELDLQKKRLEAEDKLMRKQLQEAMEQYGVKWFENDILKLTYVEPSTRITIDSARLKKELPAVAEKYSKISQVKGSVRIEVK